MDNRPSFKEEAILASRRLVGVILVLMLFFSSTRGVDPAPVEAPIALDDFGIEQTAYQVEEQSIRRNQTFSDILSAYHVAPAIIHRLAEKARPVFDLRHLRAGKALRIYRDDSLRAARLVVYQRDPVRYVVFDLRDSLQVYEGRHPVTVSRHAVHGVITSSPYQTLEALGANPALAVKLSEVFAWQIDFYRIQRGDRFSVVYEERRVNGEPVGTGQIIAARFSHTGKDYYAFGFGEDGRGGYYDEHGNTLRRAFLKAPLEYSRISSRYSLRRFHPVQKRYKPHLGTDYAAPRGTPIRATGDGEVIAASYSRGNGRYVKIRHNKTYTTGYLHMSRIARGIRPGARVRQGEVIGYVGSTGLATGPHVCYRFWKDGRQVDPLRLDLPSAQPIAEADRAAFETVRDGWMPLLEEAAPVQTAALSADERQHSSPVNTTVIAP